MKEKTLTAILESRIIAVIRCVKGERLIPMAKAFLLGGIDCVEITFDPSGEKSEQDIASQISLLTSQFGDRLCVGAGTVTTAQQVQLAAEAGAKYIVSSGTVPEVIRATNQAGLVSIPGALTATEILAAYQAGGDIVKLFPASFVGTEYLDQIRVPLSDVPLMASGGINVWNMRAFLDAGCVCVAIGGSLTGELYKPDCNYGVLAQTAKAYRAIVNNERQMIDRDLQI